MYQCTQQNLLSLNNLITRENLTNKLHFTLKWLLIEIPFYYFNLAVTLKNSI